VHRTVRASSAPCCPCARGTGWCSTHPAACYSPLGVMILAVRLYHHSPHSRKSRPSCFPPLMTLTHSEYGLLVPAHSCFILTPSPPPLRAPLGYTLPLCVSFPNMPCARHSVRHYPLPNVLVCAVCMCVYVCACCGCVHVSVHVQIPVNLKLATWSYS
jgi:hypothetical protein